MTSIAHASNPVLAAARPAASPPSAEAPPTTGSPARAKAATRSTASQAAHAGAASVATLRIGSSGPQVLDLKTRLRQLHYTLDSGPTFTQATADAVMAFQKVNGLGRDGTVGPQTRRALAHPKAPDIGDGAARRVVVDLSDQVLMVVEGGKLSKVVNASTGNPDSPDGKGVATPTGTHHVTRKVVGRDKSIFLSQGAGADVYLYDPSYFNGGVDRSKADPRGKDPHFDAAGRYVGGGIAVHGSKYVPATRDSHGCVRVPMTARKMVSEQMRVGTEVRVRN